MGITPLGDHPGHDVAVAHRPGQAAVALAQRYGVRAVGGQEAGRIGRRLRGPQDFDVRAHDVPHAPHGDLLVGTRSACEAHPLPSRPAGQRAIPTRSEDPPCGRAPARSTEGDEVRRVGQDLSDRGEEPRRRLPVDEAMVEGAGPGSSTSRSAT